MINFLQKFSARGIEFIIPNIFLKNHPDSLMCMLGNPKFDIPIDKINDAIFLDIDPCNIELVTDIYNDADILADIDLDIFQYMDLKYLNLVNHETTAKFVEEKLDCDDQQNNIINSTINNGYKYCNIHTLDSKIILLDLEFYKSCNNSLMKSILFGEKGEYIIGSTEKFVDVWFGNTFVDTNKIISILRDGINYYKKYIRSEYIQTDIFFKKYEDHIRKYNLDDFMDYQYQPSQNNICQSTQNDSWMPSHISRLPYESSFHFLKSSGNQLVFGANSIGNPEPMNLKIGGVNWGENDIAGQMMYNADVGKKINKLIDRTNTNYKKLIKYLRKYGLLKD